jgi:hypothetical protein
VTSRTAALAALAVGVVALLIALGAALFTSKPRLAGTNNVRDPVFAAVVPGGQTVCQSGEGLPKDADRLRILVGTYGASMPPLGVSIDGPGAHLRGRRPGGGPEGYVFIPIPRTDKPAGGLRVCVRNGGARRIAIAGEAVQPVALLDGGRGTSGRLRLAWYRPGDENWFQLAGTVLHRFGYGNAPWFGGWLLVVGFLMLLAAGGVAVAAALREPEELPAADELPTPDELPAREELEA